MKKSLVRFLLVIMIVFTTMNNFSGSSELDKNLIEKNAINGPVKSDFPDQH
ncbi:hypothetical protein [Terrihalobacillus insolitus]|uniref:hypothetical protein n=1 Tax=Terrihalobacillus insolitus TaxID=2950438 RepID=UPI0023415DFD|nr:hypothetical protein [Terrihalobacillus insolitus]MDC3413187.1 hypothetical protein [Terrihalobacillus insolitus]